MMRGIREKHGFSPVEVLIAMGILAIGIIAVVRLFPSGLAFTRVAQEKTIASELAGSNLARMRMAGAGNLIGLAQAGGLYSGAASATLYNMGVGQRNPTQEIVGGYAASVRRMNGGEDQALVRVTFTVDLPDGRRENFVTYITDY